MRFKEVHFKLEAQDPSEGIQAPLLNIFKTDIAFSFCHIGTGGHGMVYIAVCWVIHCYYMLYNIFISCYIAEKHGYIPL